MDDKQTRSDTERVSKRGRAPRNVPPPPRPANSIPKPPSRRADKQSSTTAPLTDVRRDLSEIIGEIDRIGAECVITKQGRPVAVIVPHDEFEALIETLNILSDPETMAAIEQSERERE